MSAKTFELSGFTLQIADDAILAGVLEDGVWGSTLNWLSGRFQKLGWHREQTQLIEFAKRFYDKASPCSGLNLERTHTVSDVDGELRRRFPNRATIYGRRDVARYASNEEALAQRSIQAHVGGAEATGPSGKLSETDCTGEAPPQQDTETKTLGDAPSVVS